MYCLAGHRNYSFVLTKASAVDKCNKAGDVYGKMLVLTFEDNEDDMINRILSLINTKQPNETALTRLLWRKSKPV